MDEYRQKHTPIETAISGRISLTEQVEAVTHTNSEMWWLPRRENKERNKSLDELMPLFGNLNSFKTYGILIPDNTLSSVMFSGAFYGLLGLVPAIMAPDLESSLIGAGVFMGTGIMTGIFVFCIY